MLVPRAWPPQPVRRNWRAAAAALGATAVVGAVLLVFGFTLIAGLGTFLGPAAAAGYLTGAVVGMLLLVRATEAAGPLWQAHPGATVRARSVARKGLALSVALGAYSHGPIVLVHGIALPPEPPLLPLFVAISSLFWAIAALDGAVLFLLRDAGRYSPWD